MYRPFRLLRHFAAGGAGEAGGGSGAVEDVFGADAGGASASDDDDPPATTGGADSGGTSGTSPVASGNLGPALGEAGRSAVITTDQLTGQGGQGQPTPPPPPTTGEPDAAAAGVFANPNEFAERLFGVKDGLINFNDGSAPTPFGSLTPAEQKEVFNQFLESQPTAAEREVLRQMRTAGSTDAYVRRRADQLTLANPAQLTDDQVNATYFKQKHPDATEEELARMVEEEKKSEFYGRRTKAMRDELTAGVKAEEERQQKAEARLFVDAARATPILANITVNDQQREEVLKDILTPHPDDPTQSVFLKKFEDPKQMFRLAWLDKYGDYLIQNLAKGQKPGGNPAGGGSGGGGGGNRPVRQVEDVFSN